MRNTTFALVISIACLAAPSLGWTKVKYSSEQLLMKNGEQMAELVRSKIKKAQKIQAAQELDDDEGIVAEPEAVDELEDAMRIVLSRPDQDGALENTFARIRRELTDLNSFENVVTNLVDESIASLKSTKPATNEHSTYIVLLENLLKEMKPELERNPKMKTLVEKIRDADIEVSEKVKRQQRMRSMAKPVSPSETAQQILPKKK